MKYAGLVSVVNQIISGYTMPLTLRQVETEGVIK